MLATKANVTLGNGWKHVPIRHSWLHIVLHQQSLQDCPDHTSLKHNRLALYVPKLTAEALLVIVT